MTKLLQMHVCTSISTAKGDFKTCPLKWFKHKPQTIGHSLHERTARGADRQTLPNQGFRGTKAQPEEHQSGYCQCLERTQMLGAPDITNKCATYSTVLLHLRLDTENLIRMQ